MVSTPLYRLHRFYKSYSVTSPTQASEFISMAPNTNGYSSKVSASFHVKAAKCWLLTAYTAPLPIEMTAWGHWELISVPEATNSLESDPSNWSPAILNSLIDDPSQVKVNCVWPPQAYKTMPQWSQCNFWDKGEETCFHTLYYKVLWLFFWILPACSFTYPCMNTTIWGRRQGSNNVMHDYIMHQFSKEV